MPVIRERRFLRVKLDMVVRCQLRCVMCHFAHPQFEENPIVMGGALLEKVAAARVKIQESLDVAKGKLARVGEAGVDKAKEAARATDDFVHEHPWKAVGIGAAIGCIVGMLISRR